MAALVAQPQASRTGLITTIVVSFLLNGLLAVVYFKQNSEAVKLRAQVGQVTSKYAEAVSGPAMGSPEYNNLKDRAQARNTSVYDVLSGQRSDLAVLVVGQPMTSPEVAQRADQANRQANLALREAAGKAGMPVAAGGSLVETLGRWPVVVNEVIDQRDRARRDAAAADARLRAAETAHRLALAAKDQAIADAGVEVAKVNGLFAECQARHSNALRDVQAAANHAAQAQALQLAAEEVAAAGSERENADLQKKIFSLERALGRFKSNPLARDIIVRAPAGQVKVVAGNECFINLGKGDQIPAGMTFDVYDANKGVGGLAGDAPMGKGSIEAISVGPDHTAQCRIVHVEPGQAIEPGDLIFNLVYDRNIKFNFFVYGDFDLGRNSHGNDAKVMRRLIEQWGGQVQPITNAADPAASVSPDADFVVIGKEPQAPNLSADELRTPNGEYESDLFRKRLEAYRAVLARAAEYGIPVMNQNRFLYYTGFYDQAKR